MAVTDYFDIPAAVPTVCGPVSDFKQLTTVTNANTLGWIGFICGVLVPIAFFVAFRYIVPIIYIFGENRGWWK
jgi:hypothetical protein